MSEYWNALASSIDAASSAALGFKGEYDALQAELAETKSLAATLGIENAALHNQVASLEGQLAVERAALDELNQANVLLTTQVRQLRATVKTYLAQIATLKARIAELESQIPTPHCTSPVWQTNVPRGTNWVKPGSTTVRVLNEVWNTAEAGPQTIKVCSPSSWYVETSQPKTGVPADRKGSVKSYPCTQVLFSKPTLASLTSLTSSWEHTTPKKSTHYWNACYDIWVGGLGSTSTAEVMVWTDYQYPGPLPPSNALKTDTVTIDGETYTAWTRKNSNGGDYIALVRQQKAAQGTVDLRKVFNYLISLGWLKSTDTLAAVNYGIEISNTEYALDTFWLDNYKLEHNGTQLV